MLPRLAGSIPGLYCWWNPVWTIVVPYIGPELAFVPSFLLFDHHRCSQIFRQAADWIDPKLSGWIHYGNLQVWLTVGHLDILLNFCRFLASYLSSQRRPLILFSEALHVLYGEMILLWPGGAYTRQRFGSESVRVPCHLFGAYNLQFEPMEMKYKWLIWKCHPQNYEHVFGLFRTVLCLNFFKLVSHMAIKSP